MQIVVAIVALVLLAVVLFVISAPLRAEAQGEPRAPEPSPELAELEAAREAKYREIRDAELDLRTGKLSRADYQAIDRALRAEALAILDRLQALTGAAAPDGPESEDPGPESADQPKADPDKTNPKPQG